mgnify:CR=1 FL=1
MISDNQFKVKTDILSNKLNAGLFEEVIDDARILLKKREHQFLYNILSIAYQSLGKFELSAKIMEKALSKNSHNPFFLNNMGISQHKLENFKEAEEFFKKGLKISPKYINILNNIGNLKKDLNLIDEAIDYYKQSLLVKEDLIETQLNLATIYTTIGKFEEAIYHFNRILEINPKFTEADRLISSITKYDENNNHFKSMISKLQDKTLDNNQLMHLHFALGKSLEDLKRYENSFHNYAKANQYLKELQPYNTSKDILIFKDIKKKFLNIKNINVKKNLRKIIFIVGMPRSGTSLTEQIISFHKKVYGGGELIFLSNVIHEHILDNKEFNISKSDDLKNLLMLSQDKYISKISLVDSSDKTFTDKAPLNFRYIGFIKNIFPNSKIINCSRDPIDICWSNYKNFFSGTLRFSNNLDDIANFYNLYQEYLKFWKKFLAEDIYDLNYEKLVQEPEIEVKKLLNFCDLEWDENCLKHENNPKSIKTASLAQARKPIYKSAIKSSTPYKKFLNNLINSIQS